MGNLQKICKNPEYDCKIEANHTEEKSLLEINITYYVLEMFYTTLHLRAKRGEQLVLYIITLVEML